MATIESVDPTAKTITLKLEAAASGEAKTKTATYSDATKFDRKDTTIQAKSLKPGDRVRVEMDSSGNLTRVSVLEKTE